MWGGSNGDDGRGNSSETTETNQTVPMSHISADQSDNKSSSTVR